MSYEFGQEVEVACDNLWLRGKYITRQDTHRVLVDGEILERVGSCIRPTPEKPALRWVVVAIDKPKESELQAIRHAEACARDMPGQRIYIMPIPSRYCVCELPKVEWRQEKP